MKEQYAINHRGGMNREAIIITALVAWNVAVCVAALGGLR